MLHTTLHAAALALLAGSMSSVALAQDGKDPKDPKAQPAATPAPRDSKTAARPTLQPKKDPATPTKGDAKGDPNAKADPNTKGGKEATPPGKITTPPTPPAPPATPAGGAAPAGDGTPPAVRTDINFPPAPVGWFRFEAFAEPVDVKLLVDMVADHLKVQIISTDTALRDKKIQLYTPVDVPPDKLLDFLGLLLEQNGQYIRKDALGFYLIEPSSAAGGNKTGDMSTTQVIPSRGLKPSGLTQAIAQVLKGGPATAGQGGGAVQMNVAGGAGPGNIAYMDDLGVLVMTDTPRRIAAVKDLIEQLSSEQINLAFTRFEVKHISATVAKQRMLELLGQAQRQSGFGGFNPNDGSGQPQPNPQVSLLNGANSSNLANRLTPDAQSNALTLRGRPEEVELIKRMLEVVDVPNSLIPKWYAVGPAAQALAEQGKRAGMGDVTVMQSTRGNQNNNGMNGNVFGGNFGGMDENGFNFYNNRFNNGNNQTANGPVFVLDADQRGFIYYGTAEQHVQLEKLVKEFGEITQAERVVYEFYKLKFVDAEKTADIIRGMINNTVPGGESPLIPGAGGAAGGRVKSAGASMVNARPAEAVAAATAGGSLDQIVATEDVHVLPDKLNNQVVVKAPQRMQAQFQRLIEKLDLRRPQVYIDAKIIVVNNREDFQLAVQTQLINAGGTGGALQTLFPGTPTNNTNILTPPTVAPPSATIGGITAAVIKSDYVPLIIQAVAQNNSGRIVASPQLLVDDNEEAEISSINQQPTTTTTIGTNGQPNTTSFNNYVDAGPKLTVKPRLSTGDLLSMKYEVELSSFNGTGANGVPPPKLVNIVKSESVTLPSDSTIIVGGLEFSQKTSTVIKVPLLGDIPIIGEAFKSTSTVDDKRTIYVFITPRIMRDPLGNDLRLFSEGPARHAVADNGLPPVRVELIEINSNAAGYSVPQAPQAPAAEPAAAAPEATATPAAQPPAAQPPATAPAGEPKH